MANGLKKQYRPHNRRLQPTAHTEFKNYFRVVIVVQGNIAARRTLGGG